MLNLLQPIKVGFRGRETVDDVYEEFTELGQFLAHFSLID
jgi:hypothetical protein